MKMGGEDTQATTQTRDSPSPSPSDLRSPQATTRPQPRDLERPSPLPRARKESATTDPSNSFTFHLPRVVRHTKGSPIKSTKHFYLSLDAALGPIPRSQIRLPEKLPERD